MDFVDWCDLVLTRMEEGRRASPNARTMGLHRMQVAEILFGDEMVTGSTFSGSKREEAMFDALLALDRLGLVQDAGGHQFWKIADLGRRLAGDTMPLWQAICAMDLDVEAQQVVRLVNRLSPQEAEDYAWVDWIEHESVITELGWDNGFDLLWAVAEELERIGFVQRRATFGSLKLHATYRGLAWETRRALTVESEQLDALVAQWETTSIDFKRELHTGTADEKAELVKDVIGLVNTQASGPRLMIIGFDDKTRSYHAAPDPKLSQNHLEQLMAVYTEPVVEIRYDIVEYRLGLVGKLEVRRDPTKLPHRVPKSVGDKKRITQGQVFVRHGSQTEQPTAVELQAILDEAARTNESRVQASEDAGV